MMNGQMNIMRREAARIASQSAHVRIATVTSYDPSNYAAKVMIQPEGYETGFLPIGTTWAGNGWGDFYGLTPGDVVYVHFQEGGKQAGFIGGSFYGDKFRPLPVPSGERWTVHQSGSFLKFHNGGSVELHTAGDLNATVGGQANLTVTGKVVASASEFDLTGNLNVTGTITASGDIFDQGQSDQSMNHIRTVYDGHTHNDPQGGTTSAPNQPL